jgi:uroporphyrinogen decarboxylase
MLPRPAPDLNRCLAAVAREPVDRMPMLELAVHPSVAAALLEKNEPAPQDHHSAVQDQVILLHRLGYDVLKVSAAIPWKVPRLIGHEDSSAGPRKRSWQDQHHGPIQDAADVNRYPWPCPEAVDFSTVFAAVNVLPAGMGLLGFSGGVLEFCMDLMGMERLMFLSIDQPGLVQQVVDRVGQVIYEVFEHYCAIPQICALWLGDDLGHRGGTLVSPRLIREFLIPWYAKYAELAHRNGRPMLMHSCGNTSLVMEDLIQAGVDAKHSFEDAIEPVEHFMDRWGDQVGILGGVDVHLLSTGPEQAIRERVRAIMDHAAHGGRSWVCGSGNSIPDYVPPGHYLAMIEECASIRG